MPNPGRLAVGVLLCAPDGQRSTLAKSLGRNGCSTEAELQALLAALDMATAAGARRLQLFGDGAVALAYAGGKQTTSVTRLLPLIAQVQAAIALFESVELQWVPRHRNTEADRLSRLALGLLPKPVKPSPARRSRRAAR